MNAFRRILVPTDQTNLCERAFDMALDLAQRFDADVMLFHAYEPPAYIYQAVAVDALVSELESVDDVAQRRMVALIERLRVRYARVNGLALRGVASDEILSVASRLECDLIVMATHGRRGVAHAFLGSVTEVVVRHANVPVLTVHPHSASASHR